MRRAALVVTTLAIVVGTLTGAALGPKSSVGTNVQCDREKRSSLTSFYNVEFYRCVDRVFSERFPYRNTLRRIKAWVDYYVFRSSPVPEVYVGIDRWLYFRHELPDYQKTACGKEQIARDLARSLSDLERILEASGRRFVVIVAPNKSTIYPEYVGLSRPSGCGKSSYDLLLDALEDFPVKGFIRLDDLLRDAKTNNQVYFMTDTHWNDLGARLVAGAILQDFPPIPWGASLGEASMVSEERVGDLAHMMGLGVRELVPRVQMKPGQFVEVEEPALPPRHISHVQVIPAASTGSPVLPRAVFYRDSFMVSALPFLKGAFEQIDAYWIQGGPIDFPTVGSEQALNASKIVLIEVVERDLGSLKIHVNAFQRLVSASPVGAGGLWKRAGRKKASNLTLRTE